ncbi:zinc-binding dehydrogenase [bacterium]|nr:zinc-binding dehydrogenase [bacterium]
MKAAHIRSHGNISNLHIVSQEIPSPKTGQALIQIHYSALNHLDLFVLKGMPGMVLPLPMIPGSDFSGMIVEINDPDSKYPDFTAGNYVSVYPGTSCGDCVPCLEGKEHYCRYFGIFGETQNGGHCEYAAIPLKNLVKLETKSQLKSAAAGGLTYLTVHEMLVHKANARPEQTVLVLAANSGIGSAAIQMAKHLGCEVIATAGDEEKAQFALKSGADHVVQHYDDPNWSDQVKEITVGKGVDIVIEHPGKATFAQSMRSLGIGGKIITCGAGSGADIKFDLRHLFIKQQQIIGSTMGSYQSFKKVQNLLMQKNIRSFIHKTYSLDYLRESYTALAGSHHQGKILIENI